MHCSSSSLKQALLPSIRKSFYATSATQPKQASKPSGILGKISKLFKKDPVSTPEAIHSSSPKSILEDTQSYNPSKGDTRKHLALQKFIKKNTSFNEGKVAVSSPAEVEAIVSDVAKKALGRPLALKDPMNDEEKFKILIECAQALQRPVLPDRYLNRIDTISELVTALNEQTVLLQRVRQKKELPSDGVTAYFLEKMKSDDMNKVGNMAFVPYVNKRLLPRE